MKSQIKVLSVVGTRPEIIRLSRVLSKLDSSPIIHHILVHTGQNYDYELNQIFFDELELRQPDYFLSAAGSNASITIGQILIKIDAVLEKENPDALLVLGDTNSCLSAIPAKKRHIPIFHMEAGNRCFDQRVPEETNRRIVDHISDINLTYSNIAREYLINEGFPSDRIIKIGSPMAEVINYFLPKIKFSNVLSKMNLKEKTYFLVSAHREENISIIDNLKSLFNSLNLIAETYKLPIIFSTHPRTRIMLEQHAINFNSLIYFEKPFSFFDYITLQINSKAVLSDSGTITEESSILGFNGLNIRDAHERPEGMEEASVMMVGLKSDRILQGLHQLDFEAKSNIKFRPVDEYSYVNVSDKVLRIILSYTDYIKRVVWHQ